MGKVYRKTLVWLGLVGLILQSTAVLASCLDESPLKQELWPEISLLEPVSLLGELRLPISAHRPELLTEARVRALINRNLDSGTLQLHLQFTFKDPRPVGLPFSFQAVLFR